MKFFDKKEQLYLETDVFEVGLRAGLLQVRKEMNCLKHTPPGNSIVRPIAYMMKGSSSAETCYSNTERGVLGILQGLQNFTTAALPEKYT